MLHFGVNRYRAEELVKCIRAFEDTGTKAFGEVVIRLCAVPVGNVMVHRESEKGIIFATEKGSHQQ